MKNKKFLVMSILFLSCIVFASEDRDRYKKLAEVSQFISNGKREVAVKIIPAAEELSRSAVYEESGSKNFIRESFTTDFYGKNKKQCFMPLDIDENAKNKKLWVAFTKESYSINKTVVSLDLKYIVAHSWGGLEVHAENEDPRYLIVDTEISFISCSPRYGNLVAIGSNDDIKIIDISKTTINVADLSKSFKNYYDLENIKEQVVEPVSEYILKDLSSIAALQYTLNNRLIFCSDRSIFSLKIDSFGKIIGCPDILFTTDKQVKSLAVSHNVDSNMVAVGSEDGELTVHYMNDSKTNNNTIKIALKDECSINSLNFSPDNKILTVRLANGKVGLFSVKDKIFNFIQTLNHNGEVGPVEFELNGSRLVVKYTEKHSDEQQGKEVIVIDDEWGNVFPFRSYREGYWLESYNKYLKNNYYGLNCTPPAGGGYLNDLDKDIPDLDETTPDSNTSTAHISRKQYYGVIFGLSLVGFISFISFMSFRIKSFL